MEDLRERVRALADSVLTGTGIWVVDAEIAPAGRRTIVRLYIDKPGGVSVDDCARVSRSAEDALDTEDVFSGAYVLEVSSPGMERPLKSVADWRRFAGRQAAVKSAALGGRLEVMIVGIDGEPGAEVATLRDARGDHRVAIADVQDARLAFHWTR